jgi:hypothetical protein
MIALLIALSQVETARAFRETISLSDEYRAHAAEARSYLEDDRYVGEPHAGARMCIAGVRSAKGLTRATAYMTRDIMTQSPAPLPERAKVRYPEGW